MDEFSRECLAIDVAKRLTSEDVLERLSDLFVHRGVPEHIRSDNGSEFTAKCVREWLGRVGVKTLFIEPGSPWENGYVESFNGKLRDELLEREAFDTLLEAKVLIERWRQHYNTIRPHSSLGYRPPAPEALQPCAVENVTANLCACQAAFSRRRSSSPSDPSRRARTLPMLFGSISGTGEGLLAGLARRKPMKLNSNDGSPKKPSEDDKEKRSMKYQSPPRSPRNESAVPSRSFH
jgi:hypothetical protein